MPLNKGFVLGSHAEGAATESNFRFFEREVGEPGPHQVLVRNLWLSLDPYMRGRMNESRSYTAAQAGRPGGVRQAQMARDHRRGHRKCAVCLSRHAQGQELRQTARQTW